MRKVNKKRKPNINFKEKSNIDKEKIDNSKLKKNTPKNKNNNNKTISSKNKKNKKAKPKRSIWKKIITLLLILGIIGVLAIAGFFAYIVITAPEFDEKAFNVNDQTVIYDINGEIITKLGVQKRESVTYDQLPQVLIDAIIATEDSRFFQHNGVDLPRFLKATAYQLVGKDEAGGASTLTMQVVKNNLTKKETVETDMVQKIVRKFQDVYLSVFKVEKEYSKQAIIELYVNNYGLGSSVYGVGEAAKYYFGKSVSELTLPEAALIAGLFQAPNRHNPYKNLESATARRNTVLNLMVRHEYITKEEADMAREIDIESLLVGIEDDSEYQGFVDTVVSEVEELTGQNPAIVPMKIYTTMEKKIQDGINKTLASDSKILWKDDIVQSGIAVINVKTGAIAAIGAGRNRTGERTFNYATQALKQPGSTAKPIFAYGPGFEYNNYSTYTMFVDEPWAYTNGPSINNWDGNFFGMMTARTALAESRNIPALKAIQDVGIKKSQQFAYSLGLDVALNQNSENYRIIDEKTGLDNTINEAYSIGGVAEGFSPLTMAAAYSGFASGGYYTKPYSVTKIEYRETGEIVDFKPTKERVMKDSTAFMINDILKYAVDTNYDGGAKVYGSIVAAKTGTSNFPDNIMKKHNLPGDAVNDLWTVAYTSDYSVAVWYGYDKVTDGYNRSSEKYKNNVTAEVMKYIPKSSKGWTPPYSVIQTEIEKETWPAKKTIPEYTPNDLKTNEYFIRGTQPTESSERFAKLNDISNTIVTPSGNNAVTISWNHTTPNALTDEYIKNYFNKPVFGNRKENLINDRKNYNTNILGNIVFAIYRKNEDETLTLLGSTTENSYYYEGYESVTLVIKAEHQKYKKNASSGISVDITFNNSSSDNYNLVGTLNGERNIQAKVGNYKELGVKNVIYGNVNVLNQSEIKYQIINGTTITEYTSIENLEKTINQLPAGTYKINYIISYKNKELIKNRTITLN